MKPERTKDRPAKNKGSQNDKYSSKPVADAQVELATFINALPVATKCPWTDLIPIRKRITDVGFVKASDVAEIRSWAKKHMDAEPVCAYLLTRFPE